MIPFKMRRAVAVVAALPVAAMSLSTSVSAASTRASAGPPSVEITAVSPGEVSPGDAVDVGFDASRAWPYAVDFRESSGQGDWVPFDGDDEGTAAVGSNEAALTVPADTADATYDVRVRLFREKNNKVADVSVAPDALRVEAASPDEQFVADFSDGPSDAPPEGWTQQWRDSSWSLLDGPERVRHEVGDSSGRRSLTWQEPGDNGLVDGDVEVHGVVRMPEHLTSTRFQMPLHVSGDAGSENAYYLDGRRNSVRINRYVNGSFQELDTASLNYDVDSGMWHRVVLRRDGDQLMAKMWPNGMAEPAEWQVTVQDTNHDGGRVGMAHFAAGSVTEWGWYSVGVNGTAAPRAPRDLFPLPEPDPLLTGFEERAGSGWTTHEEELAFLDAVDDASDRVTVSQVGTSVEGLPIHLARVGAPAPPSDEEIAAGKSVLVLGSQHGNEPAGREMALQLLRDLAMTDDPELIGQLSDTTVLIVPSANPDAREAHTRRNADGVDTNRDHLHLETAEAQTMAQLVRDFGPDIVVDAHERPTGSSPDMELLWPRNLNVHAPVRDLAQEMVEDYVTPDVKGEGFSTGLYSPAPGGAGDENETIARNAFGLRHTLGMLTESAGHNPPAERVEAQLATAYGVLRFQRERAGEIERKVAAAPVHKETVGGDQSEPFFLFGADNDPPAEEDILDPPPCGYVINTAQAERLATVVDLFSLRTEPVGDHGVFVTMAQPSMTVVPLLMDPDARANLVEGIALYDPAECEDPGTVEPPPMPTGPGQFSTDFTGDTVGEPPADWENRWNPSELTIKDDPRRMVLQPTTSAGAVAAYNPAREVRGDVEVAGVVRVPDPMPTTRFQLHLHVNGDADSRESYYLDTRPSSIRIRKYDGGSTGLESESFDGMAPNSWYQVVFQREGNTLRGKVWPYGADEPAEWMVEVTDSGIGSGRVGVGHFGSDSINEWAWFGVGTGGEQAPRAPADLVPEPDQVTNTAVDPGTGIATVTWDEVDGATAYEIERSPVRDPRSAEVVGRWFPNRYDGDELTFADAGFTLGERYRWRVRALNSGVAGEWSEAVEADTAAAPGPAEYRTGFEAGDGAEWTTHDDELEVLNSIAADSDRVRLEEIGRTAEDRPLHLAAVGAETPGSPEEIAEQPSVLFICTIHGTEPAAREACLMTLRKLAFSDDPEVTRVLDQTTVLFVPTANPDGRAANQRENTSGLDPNRDHLHLSQPETLEIARVVRDYQPDVVIDGHEYQAADASDLSVMWPRSLNLGDDLWSLSQDDLARDHMFGAATDVGLWPLEYPLSAHGWEGQTHNATGLKNHVSLLIETRRRPGPTRPSEGDANTLVTTPENQKRRVYTQAWAMWEVLEYHYGKVDAIQAANTNAAETATKNEGPVYLDGRRDVPVSPPSNDDPTLVLDPPPCGYRLTDDQLAMRDGATATVGERLAAHGIVVNEMDDGAVVPMAQPLRGLIPYILDPESPVGLIAAQRLETCGVR